MKWNNINNEINKYIEHIVLPELIAFSIYKMYKNNYLGNDSYLALYNSIKSYINIVDIDYFLIYKLVKEILLHKYHLKIILLKPLILKESI